MQLQLKFEAKDFVTFRTFNAAVKRQLGTNVYVGTDSLCFYFDYPKELAALLRPPDPKGGPFEFTLESSLPDSK